MSAVTCTTQPTATEVSPAPHNGQQKSPARRACEANETAYANRVQSEYFDRIGSRILTGMAAGAVSGAIAGGKVGFSGGEGLEPLGGGIPGALAGGFIGVLLARREVC